jgi:hypothetical protein
MDAKKTPIFRSARGRTGELTSLAMHRVDAWRMSPAARETPASTPKSLATGFARLASPPISTARDFGEYSGEESARNPAYGKAV